MLITKDRASLEYHIVFPCFEMLLCSLKKINRGACKARLQENMYHTSQLWSCSCEQAIAKFGLNPAKSWKGGGVKWTLKRKEEKVQQCCVLWLWIKGATSEIENELEHFCTHAKKPFCLESKQLLCGGNSGTFHFWLKQECQQWNTRFQQKDGLPLRRQHNFLRIVHVKYYLKSCFKTNLPN